MDHGTDLVGLSHTKAPSAEARAETILSAPSTVGSVLREPGRPLSTSHRTVLENRFGHELSHVRIHDGSRAAESARAVSAAAYTVGSHIVLGSGRDVSSMTIEDPVLAHEVVHVIQQGLVDVDASSRAGPLTIASQTGALEEEAARLAYGGHALTPERRAVASVLQRQLYPPIPIVVVHGGPVEITAVDARVEGGTPWYVPSRYAGPLASFFRGDVVMTDITTMVVNVVAELRGRKMDRLNIMDHGNQDVVQIGDDRLSTAPDVAAHAGALNQLQPHFSGGAFVHMQNCEAGQNKDVICALAQAFGVPVYAGTGDQNALYGFNFGDYVRCDSDGKFHPNVGRPRTPSRPVTIPGLTPRREPTA